ncbi:MAG: hypothetical protein FWG49_00350 [Leptospirales bacterium]|nr:hypothetical protein [Leptospirales bacterium]
MKRIIFTIIVICVSASAGSDPLISLKSFFTDNEIKSALNGEFLTSAKLKGRGSANSGEVENTLPAKNGYLNAAESEFDMIAIDKGFFKMEGSDKNRERIYRLLTDFSHLKGMEYYSQSDKKNSSLILKSYKIDSTGNSISNNKKDNIPEKTISNFAIQDNRLGLLTFKSELVYAGDNFIVTNILSKGVTKYGMNIFNPNDYRVYKFLIYDNKSKGYFFYTIQFMRVRSNVLSSFNLIKPESFGNRVRAEDIHFLKNIGIERSGKLAAFK